MRYPVIVLALCALHCAHATAGGGGEPVVKVVAADELPPECGETASIARARTNLSYVERDTIDLLSEACVGAARERDGLGGGACAAMLPTIAGWRHEVLNEARGAAMAREKGDASGASVFSARIRAIRAEADARGAPACASRDEGRMGTGR